MLAALALVLVASSHAAAQTSSRPGPWVLDVRGATSPTAEGVAFYPPLDSTALIPERGFGVDLGAHAYLFNLGPSRVGIGADLLHIRSRTQPPDPPAPEPGSPAPARGQSVQVDTRTLSPQLSFNFGRRDGWSYVSAGIGKTRIVTKTNTVGKGRRETNGLNSFNVGGGARWFLKSHVAFTFDVRFYRIAAGTAGPIELEITPPIDPDDPEDPESPEEPPPPPVPVGPAATPGQLLVIVGAGFSFR